VGASRRSLCRTLGRKYSQIGNLRAISQRFIPLQWFDAVQRHTYNYSAIPYPGKFLSKPLSGLGGAIAESNTEFPEGFSKESRKTPMKRTFARFVLPVVLMSAAAVAQAGTAAAAPAASTPASTTPAATGPVSTKVGIINIQQAIVLTNEGKRDLDALEKKFEPTRTSLQGQQKEIADMENQLKTQGDKLNDEARSKLAKDLDSKRKSFQRSAEDAQADFQQQQGELVNRIGGKLMEVLDKYAKSNGYSMIVDVSNPQSPVLWAAAATDVTQEVATAYNSTSNIPAPPANAPSATRPGGAGPRPTASTTPPRPATTTPK
jgi:outer membrane protein